MKCAQCVFRSPAAAALNLEELSYLSQNCAEVMLRPGESILREGTLSSHVAYIKKGLAKIHMLGPHEEDQVLKLAGPGSYIGIQTILAERVHKFSATCLEAAQVCYIDIHSFKELLKRNPDFSYALILYLCKEELLYFERLSSLSSRQVHGRLAQTILYIARMYDALDKPFRVPLSRLELASMINTSRESVSRALRELASSGTIRLDGRRLEILSRDLLEKISRSG